MSLPEMNRWLQSIRYYLMEIERKVKFINQRIDQIEKEINELTSDNNSKRW